MSDGSDSSEQLDGDVLGEQPGDAERPAAVGYPPDRAFGVEDPSLLAEDDLDTRAHARRALSEDPRSDPDGDAMVLVDVTPDGEIDQVAALLADEARSVDGDDLAAEEAAMHLVDQDPVD